MNKFLSNAGIASRRNCAEFIKNGLVKVNGKDVKQPGYRVKPGDEVSYRDKKIESGKKTITLQHILLIATILDIEVTELISPTINQTNVNPSTVNAQQTS